MTELATKAASGWGRIIIALVAGLMAGQCVSMNSRLADINSDQFALRLKLDRIERKIDGMKP